MLRLDIRFATSWQERWSVHSASVLGLILCLAVAAWVGSRVLSMHNTVRVAELHLATLRADGERRQQSQTKREQGTGPKLNRAQAKAVNTAIDSLNLGWEELFDALEGSATAKISLLSIELTESGRDLVLTAEAADANAWLEYVRNLRLSGQFHSVIPRSHKVEDKDKNHPIKFVLDLGWGRGEHE